MFRKVFLLALLWLVVFLAGQARPVQAVCTPCQCFVCVQAPARCCTAAGEGTVNCGDWASRNCAA
jgi:hypothetical protein